MTDLLFDAKKAIESVFPMIENIPTEKGDIAIGGGVVADAYFGKGARDIDVFVSSKYFERVAKFAKYYGFSKVEKQQQITSGYGRARRIVRNPYSNLRGANMNTNILEVYKGFLLGYPVDIVVVNIDDIEDHIYREFDLSIKTCHYNGFGYFYSKTFLNTIRTGKITPVRFDPVGYARAYMSAEKYGLSVSSKFNMTRDYLAYVNDKDMLDSVLSEKTFSQFRHFNTDKLLNYKYDKANVILVDLLTRQTSANEADKLYKKFTSIANSDVTTHHPLSKLEFNVGLGDKHYHEYAKYMKAVQNNIGSYFEIDTPEETAAKEDFSKLLISEEQFTSGKIKDENNREVKLGKYIKKLCRKHADVLEEAYEFINKAVKAFEERGVKPKSNVYFTANKYALTHISTDTEWSSCQRWEFGGGAMQNFGLLGNVSGATLVAYFADERCDTEPKKWKGRMLVRIGQDGSMFLERVYSTRSEYTNSRKAVVDQLKDMGYKVYTTTKNVSLNDFVSLDMWSMPYNDCGLNVKTTGDGQVVMKGYGYYKTGLDAADDPFAGAEDVPFMRVFEGANDDPFADNGADQDGNEVGPEELPF